MPIKRVFVSVTFIFGLIVSNAQAKWREYVGIHHSGFELYSFCECGSQKCWWLETIDDAKIQISDFRRDLLSEMSSEPANDLSDLPGEARYIKNYPRLFMKVEGFLSPLGEYGHLGMWDHKIWVRKVSEIRQPTESDLQRCR